MPNVLNEFAGDGVTKTFNFSMTGGYLSRDYVYFFTRPNDDLLNYTQYNDGDVTWITDFSVQIANPIPVGTTFVILRSTTLDPIVDFQNTSRITEKNLDTATRQSIHIAAETSDGMGRVTAVTGVALENSKDAVRIAEDAKSDAVAAKADAAEAKYNAANSLSVAQDALDLVESAVAGGVSSFNGRVGGVVPQAGDYDKALVGLPNVDNTADKDKPLSDAAVLALQGKASAQHSHAMQDVDGLTQALASKADAQATSMALAGKAQAEHTHQAADVDGLSVFMNNTAAQLGNIGRATGNSSKFFSNALFGVKDVTTILLQSDSTGNEDWEFFYKFAQKLVARFPDHLVSYRLWSHATQTWDVRNLSNGTGSNPRRIYLYNGAVSGSNATYWKGARRANGKAYDGWQFDMIVVNYGLNTPGDAQMSAAVSNIYDLRVNQPNAEIVGIIQPPDYNSVAYDGPGRSVARNTAQRRVYGEFGLRIVDLFTEFTRRVNASTVDAWYMDRTHPNEAGQALWADILYSSIEYADIQHTPIPSGPSVVPNALLSRWPNGGGAAPLWWAVSNGAARDTVIYPNRAGMRAYGGVGTGVAYVNVSDVVRKAGATELTAVMNIATSGTSGLAGIPYFSRVRDGVTTEWTGVGQGYAGESAGGQHWVAVTLPRDVVADARPTDVFRVGVWTGTPSEWVSVFSVGIGAGLIPPLPVSEGFSTKVVWDEGAVVVPASGSKTLSVGGANYPYIARGAVYQSSVRLPNPFVTKQDQDDISTVSIMFANSNNSAVTVPAQTITLNIS